MNIYRHTASAAWHALLSAIKDTGCIARPRGLLIKELLATTTGFHMNYPIVASPRRKLGYKFMCAEAWWILSGRNDVASIASYSKHIASFSNDGRRFDGAYGPKIVDQLRYVVDTLLEDPESRQAVLTIWRPNPRPSKDVPCTISAQWLIREGSGEPLLHCVDTMRSSDAWLGWPYDAFNFSMLSAMIAADIRAEARRRAVEYVDSKWTRLTNLQLGNCYITAGSQHYYVEGAANIPYTEEHVKAVIDDGVSRIFSYSPLSLDKFNDGSDVLQFLAAMKDRAHSPLNRVELDKNVTFMREFVD